GHQLAGGGQALVLLRFGEAGQFPAQPDDIGVLLAVQIAELADDDVGALGEALQGTAQGRQHDVGGVAQAYLDMVEQAPEYRAAGVAEQLGGEPAQFALGMGLPFGRLAADAFDLLQQVFAVALDAVRRQADGQVRLEALFHEFEELLAGFLDQLALFHLAHQLTLALLQLGDDVGEVGDDAFGELVGVEQIVDLAAVGEGRQGVEGVAGVAVAGAHAVRDRLAQGLGEEPTQAAEGVGGLEGHLIDLTLQPALIDQGVENPAGLFAAALEAALIPLPAVQQRRTLQRLAEDVEHLTGPKRFAVLGSGAVQTNVQQAQTFDYLFPVYAGQGEEELQSLVTEEHASGSKR